MKITRKQVHAWHDRLSIFIRNQLVLHVKLVWLIIFLFPETLFSQVEISRQSGTNGLDFPIISGKISAGIYCDPSDFEAVKTSAKLFGADVERVTGKMLPVVSSKWELKEYAIIVGTVDKNQLINELVAEKKLDIDSIRHQWERFTIKTIDNPFPGVKKALVIAGSDRRGTAYGVFTLSEAIGVSPWYWWADVAVPKSSVLKIKNINYLSKSPSVKYRGIFINDEDWGIFQWAKNTFEPEVGNIGYKTYEKVFELMLRLRLNYIWLAMHACSTEFGMIPGSVALADRYGIVAGSSHCEPMLCNNVHWDQKARGPWNYSLNRDTIHAYWEDNVKARATEEAVWTLGIRGIHDLGMQQPPTETTDRINLVQQVFKDQRALLNQYVSKEWGDVAQCFVPYKEVLPLYDAGLKVADDVTVMWVDDNFGYIRRLGMPAERSRSGGAGVYWHLSYYGGPHSYLWLNSTPPALMWEELHKAWENNAGKIWVINVGDIKPMEIGIDYFSKLAWNTEDMATESQPKFLRAFAATQFEEKMAQPIADLLGEYYRLGTIRKPEQMTRAWAMTLPSDRAAQLRLDYEHLLKKEKEIDAQMSVQIHDAYFEIVGFSARILGASGLIFMVDRNWQLGGDSIAAQNEITHWRKYIETQVNLYNNEGSGGKWKYMMPGMETEKNLTKWSSQVRWPWGEQLGVMPKLFCQPNRTWRNAASADRQSTSGNAKWTVVSGLGATGKALVLEPANLGSSWKIGDTSAPTLEYDFQTKADTCEVRIDFLPTFRICPGMQLRISVSVDEQTPTEVEVPGSNGKEDENGRNRREGIMNNYVEAKVQLSALSSGKHVLKIRAVDPGVVIDKISFY